MKFNKYICAVAGSAALLCALCAGSQFASAQQTTADIIGTVTDPSGAVLPDASVMIDNLATHETRVTTTTGTGDYAASLLKPGTYSITITSAGFQAFHVSSVSLAAGDRTRVNAKMAVGNTSQTVTVEAAGTALQTDSSVLSTTISNKATQDLPLNGRNFLQLIQLVPGVNEGPPDSLVNGTKPDDERQSAAISVNGQSDVMNNEMIDGADNYERLIGSIAVRPSIDSIAELSVQTNTYTAEVGRTGGGIINVITKSGSNQFHGGLFEFFRNDKLNTNTYNFGATVPKAVLRRNQYGGSLGGPIIKSKAFFFGGFESYRQVQGTAPSVNVVPTLYEEQNPGDFSDVGGPLICTSTGVPAGCTGHIDSVALNYFKMYPAPNYGANEWIAGSKNIQNSDVYDARVDYSLNPANMFYGRFIYNYVHTDSPGALPEVTVAGLKMHPGGFANYANDQAYDALFNYIHTFRSNLLFELKAAYTRANLQTYPQTEGLNPNEAFGQPGINTNYADSDASALALVIIANGTSLGQSIVMPIKDQDNTFQYLGALTYTRGAHNFKMGGTVIRRQMTSFQSTFPEGLWIFLDYPSFLQGQFLSNGGRSLELSAPHLRTWEPAVYLQDDWHVRKNLTLNLGLRYDLYTPYTEIENRISTWNPDNQSLMIAGQNGISKTAGIETDYHGLAPRFGFSYNPGRNWVIRGGYGIGYFPMNVTSNANLKNPPFVATATACNTPGWGANPCAAGYTTFADGLPISSMKTPADITLPGATIVDAVDPHFRTSYMQQFNLTVQKDWTGNVMTISYVGLLGRQLGVLLPDANTPPPNTCSSSSDPVCYQKLRPTYSKFPNLGVIGYFRTGGNSSYNALQASAQRAIKKGLSVNANYTWSHNLEDTTGLSEGFAGGYGMVPSKTHELDYGNANLDMRQRVAATALYQLPFGQHATGARGLLTKGWQANLIGVWSTGVPFTVVNSSNVSNTVTAQNDRPNQIGNTKVNRFSVSQFFNTAAFTAQASGTLGNERRNQLFGPHYRHIDLSVFKTFPIKERTNVEFRAESFNLTNTANFSTPNATLNGANFGAITAMTTNYTPRVLQFALKVSF